MAGPIEYELVEGGVVWPMERVDDDIAEAGADVLARDFPDLPREQRLEIAGNVFNAMMARLTELFGHPDDLDS